MQFAFLSQAMWMPLLFCLCMGANMDTGVMPMFTQQEDTAQHQFIQNALAMDCTFSVIIFINEG